MEPLKPVEVYWSWDCWGLPLFVAHHRGRWNVAVLGLHVEFGRT